MSMESRRREKFAPLGAWLPNIVVLGTLLGIGWWGHTHHWSFPHWSDLVGSPDAVTETGPVELPSSHRANSHETLVPFPGRLPTVEFASAEAAHNCGIEAAPAETRSMEDVVVAAGIVGYDQTHLAQLAVRVPGIVWRVEKWVGDVVERGDVLMVVDAADVGHAKANLLEAVVINNLKKQTYQRLSENQSSLPPRDILEAKAEQEVSRAQQANALQKLVNLGFPLRNDDVAGLSPDQLSEKLHLLGIPPSLDVQTESDNLIPLVAPFSGIVTSCDVVRGEMVEPTKPQYVLADISRMWINLDIRQDDASQARLGAKVIFKSEGGLRPVPCTLTWIGTEVDPRTRTVRARAEADNPFLDETQSSPGARRLLQVGAFGSAEILSGSNPASIVIPNDAIRWQWEIGRQVVFVPTEDGRHFAPRVVRKGLVHGDHVEILDGLEAGDQVVTAGSRVLSSELSELLREHVGDNAEAIRGFDAATGTSSTTR